MVWLVSGNVTIAGTVDLSGEGYDAAGITFNAINQPFGGRLAEPGPGGFRGGAPWRGGGIMHGAGFGMGGGQLGKGYHFGDNRKGGPGHFGPGQLRSYGNPSLVPLIGGSGGAGAIESGSGYGGGAGGGAILVASRQKVEFIAGGQLLAIGGMYEDYSRTTGAGSGGAVRMICSEIAGIGSVNAAGGGGGWPSGSNGGDGRIRLERVANTANLTITPAPSTVDLTDGSTAMIWPPEGAPEARIVAVNEIPAPNDPKAAFGAYTPDVALPLVSSANVVVETVNVEQVSKVIVRITPRNGRTVDGVQSADLAEVNATIKEVVSETPLKLRWEATVPTLPGYSAIQARIVRP